MTTVGRRTGKQWQLPPAFDAGSTIRVADASGFFIGQTTEIVGEPVSWIDRVVARLKRWPILHLLLEEVFVERYFSSGVVVSRTPDTLTVDWKIHGRKGFMR